ncbi:hypothetical protein [Fluviicola sp.]|uniref:hypothetical protein n=1 Tax=Fluviicola sp. TaxID=1917219 RepID=UPI0031CF9941
MKQNTLRSLSFSLILLFSFSCKKEKGALYDFPPGRFEFVYVLNTNTNQDTIIGELSGPYLYSSNYSFMVRQELLMDKSLKIFKVGTYKSINNGIFKAQVNTGATIDYEDHDSDHLMIHFASGDTLSGSLTLTRKE